MAVDDQLAELLLRQANLYDTLEERQNADILILAGTVDDPNSFDQNGGKLGPLGFYPIVNVNGQVGYFPCLARMRAAPLETVDAALTELGEATSQKFAEVDAALGDFAQVQILASILIPSGATAIFADTGNNLMLGDML